ncbi:MAG TPA: coenzyme F420-0:L-glutamate ligase, partial [Candidatus Nitrosotenuis sp.]|nr:coenzyme F420-0:L-glutamate ligase [Candidatus Nitrosotenuis sp.]
MTLSVIPIRVEKKQTSFDLYQSIIDSLNDVILENGDVMVISSKYISNSQNRLIDLEKVRPSADALALSKKYQLGSRFSEVILRESDSIFGGIAGFVLTSSDNILAPNAGIDKSNVKKGTVILYPDNPYLIAEQMRRKILLSFGVSVGVIIVDSRLMPTRIGTSGVAIACAGLEPVQDMRGQKDLDGNPLKVTLQATADNLATIAYHKMGEGSESTPIAIVRNSGARLTARKISPTEMAISSDLCV